MSIVVVVEVLQVFLIRLAFQLFMKRLDDELQALIAPYESGNLLLRSITVPGLQCLVQIEAQPQDVLLELVVRYSAIEVVIHLPHQLEHLLFGDEEAHALQRLVELIHFDKLILVQVNLVEHLLESQPLLLQHLEQMVEDVVLSHHPLFLRL